MLKIPSSTLPLISLLFLFLWMPKLQVKSAPVKNVAEVASYLEGIMDTRQQAQKIPGFPKVQMTACRVQLSEITSLNQNAIYLYQEQAMINKLDKPYRQRFLRLSLTGDGKKVESATFRPVNSVSWINFCQQKKAARIIKESNITNAKCSVFLQKIADRIYRGETQTGGCAINYKGAVKITNTIELKPAQMTTYDRGFDASGKQVWGANERPYIYRKTLLRH